MSSLIPISEKISCEDAMQDVFDTFKRPIRIFKSPEKVYISTDPNFSRFGQFGRNDEMSKVVINQPVIETIEACILYGKNNSFEQYNKSSSAGQNEQIKLRDTDTRIRIKVDIIGYNILKDAKLLDIDGRNFTRDSMPRCHGLFAVTRWSFFFKEQL
jgi:hypothetical protein